MVFRAFPIDRSPRWAWKSFGTSCPPATWAKQLVLVFSGGWLPWQLLLTWFFYFWSFRVFAYIVIYISLFIVHYLYATSLCCQIPVDMRCNLCMRAVFPEGFGSSDSDEVGFQTVVNPLACPLQFCPVGGWCSLDSWSLVLRKQDFHSLVQLI